MPFTGREKSSEVAGGSCSCPRKRLRLLEEDLSPSVAPRGSEGGIEVDSESCGGAGRGTLLAVGVPGADMN
jgi:hypothetical protein